MYYVVYTKLGAVKKNFSHPPKELKLFRETCYNF